MSFPAPPVPAFGPDHAATTEAHLRYEDVTQDGRLIPIAIPPALGGLWRSVLVRNSGARAAQAAGIVPILTRITITSHDRHIRVDKPIEAHTGFELARDAGDGEVQRLFMNIWSVVRGTSGRLVPFEPAGPQVVAGELFAEHTFTRPFAQAVDRRVTRLPGAGFPEVPEPRYAAPTAASAGELPAGARAVDTLAPDPAEVVLTLDQTDSNQHVNSLVYIRVFLDAVQRRLATGGHPLAVRSRAVDIAYRKPCFAGDRVRAHLRLFAHDGGLGAAGFIAADGDDRPRCYVRVLLAA